MSGSSTPEAVPQDLWFSILDSVSSTRAIPSKQILLLGQPSSGKSTIAAALLQKQAVDEENISDFALGYDFANVRDEADEDTLARLSVYTVPSSAPSYMALVPHYIPPRTALPHTLIMIVLDWTRPWTFVDELQSWLQWIETWAKGDASREVEIAREEGRERLQSHLQHYSEPSSDPIPTVSSALSNTVLPLGPGTFTHNSSGVPIVVVCSKADLIDEEGDLTAGASGMGGMVKGKGGEWEERTDGVMQVLRTICLKYGAGLFYTTPVPATLQVLRQYALHMLFTPPATTPDAPVAPRNLFPFSHKPNTLDRDRIVVPAGWDSWGMITLMRDGFEAKSWGEAWETDIDGDAAETEPAAGGARKLFSALVPDQGTKPPPFPPFNDPTPEQAFLAKNYDENSKKPDRDPRGAFRNPTEPGGPSAAGIVGPLGSSSFNLPTVERALTEMEVSIGGAPSSSSSKSRTTRPAAAGLSAVGTGAGNNATSPALLGVRPPTSPTLSATPSPTGGQTQHEVLQNFFQSLLSSKDRAGAAAAAAGGATGSAKPSPSKPGAQRDGSGEDSN